MMKKNSRKHTRRRVNYQEKKKNQLFIALGFYIVLAVLTFKGNLPLLLFVWYGVIGALTYLIYAKDKKAAKLGHWRVPETSLHLLSLIGGWVGAMVAQNYLRHKTQKPDFRVMYYLTVVLNMAGLLYVIVGGDISKV